MSQRPPSVDETILSLLQARDVLASADLASALVIHERSVRRHLRRLIRGGYVFSPEHGRYRITAAGGAVMDPIEAPPIQVESRPGRHDPALAAAIDPVQRPAERHDPARSPTSGRPPLKVYDRFRSRR